MDCKELRIGNLIEWFSETYKVSMLDVDSEVCALENLGLCSIEDWKPIPLTEELLLKFGFKYIKEKNQYYFNGLSFFKSLQETKGFCLNLPENRFFGVFEYVHQLQNLVFSIKNIELEIKQDGTV